MIDYLFYRSFSMLYKVFTNYIDDRYTYSTVLPISEPNSPYVSQLAASAARFSRIVIWGLRLTNHTHRYIFLGYYNNLREAGLNVVWLEDTAENNNYIKDNDIVFVVNVASKNIIYKEKCFYVLHNVEFAEDEQNRPCFDRTINLQVYTHKAKQRFAEVISPPFILWESGSRTLYQPWGTDVPPYRFSLPIPSKAKSNIFYWIGSIWNNELNQGNIHEIGQLKKILHSNGIIFKHVFPVPSSGLVKLTQRSAMPLAGSWQVNSGYLPCRVFKNVSFGCLSMTNVVEFNEIFKGVISGSISEMIDAYKSLPSKELLERIRCQQEDNKKYTYFSMLKNIFSLM